MIRYRARAVLLLFGVLYVTACSSWQSIGPVSPSRFIELDQPERVRVTMQDGTQMELDRPVVDGDELVSRPIIRLDGDELVAAGGSVSLADVRLLEIGKISLVRSGLAGFGIFVGGIILIQFVECGVDGTWAC